MTRPPSSISFSERFDQIRHEHPELALNLYAMTPGGDVTLEVITPDGESYSWTAFAASMAMALAFPSSAPADAPAEPTGDIFS